jgi:hypothetical protein
MSKSVWNSLAESIHQLFETVEPVEPKETIESRFIKACTVGDIDTVNDCLDKGVNPEHGLSNMFCTECYYGRIKVVDRLLQEPTIYPSTGSICYASENGHADVVYLLLQNIRVAPSFLGNYDLRTACCMACTNGHNNVVDILLQDKRINLEPFFQYAREFCNTKIIEMIQASLARLRFSQVKT